MMSLDQVIHWLTSGEMQRDFKGLPPCTKQLLGGPPFIRAWSKLLQKVVSCIHFWIFQLVSHHPCSLQETAKRYFRSAPQNAPPQFETMKCLNAQVENLLERKLFCEHL
jgi:hypothetical protein